MVFAQNIALTFVIVIIEAAPTSVNPTASPRSPESTSSYEMDFQAVQTALDDSTTLSDDTVNETSGLDVSTESTPADSLTNSTMEIFLSEKEIKSTQVQISTIDVSHELEIPSEIHLRVELFVLSARSETSLRAIISNLRKWATTRKNDTSLHDLAYTLSSHRTHHQYRYSTVASTYDDLITSLDEASPRITKSSASFRSIFIFTGQGKFQIIICYVRV